MSILHHPSEVTPKLATSWLRQSGVLDSGDVIDVNFGAVRSTDISTTTSLSLTYSKPVPAACPGSLFFKSSAADRLDSNAELRFHQLAEAVLQGQALLPFYAGGYSTDSRSCYLVLENVSKSHILNPRLDEPDWFRSEYTLQSAQQIVDGFAQVHSHFWGDAQLGLTMGIHPEDNLLPDEGDIMGGYAYDRDRVDRFLLHLDARTEPRIKDLFRRVSEVYPKLLLARIQSGVNLTLTHCDPHTGNVLVPINPQTHKVAIVDWANYTQWIGVHDLSSHFVPFWYRSVRRAVEERMIRRYHESLLRAGVSGYTWDQCWYDYRLGVVGQFNRRIKHDPFNSAVGVWTHDNCISAFEDLQCQELLE